jgi:hypothetical protein
LSLLALYRRRYILLLETVLEGPSVSKRQRKTGEVSLPGKTELEKLHFECKRGAVTVSVSPTTSPFEFADSLHPHLCALLRQVPEAVKLDRRRTR